MGKIFSDSELGDLWEAADAAYGEPPLDDATLASVEAELGVTLPRAYVELARSRNGGVLARTLCPPAMVSGIFGIGRTNRCSLCGRHGSAFRKSGAGYPDIGVYFADTPSAGHEMIALDYRACGPYGEPSVVVVFQESDYAIRSLAPTFEAFIRSLRRPEPDPEPTPSERTRAIEYALIALEQAVFSAQLQVVLDASGRPELGRALRRSCSEVVREKGDFSLHGDPRSHLVYDVLFLAFSLAGAATSAQAFLAAYPDLIGLVFHGFGTHGYALGFVSDWLEGRLARGEIVASADGSLAHDAAFRAALETRVAAG